MTLQKVITTRRCDCVVVCKHLKSRFRSPCVEDTNILGYVEGPLRTPCLRKRPCKRSWHLILEGLRVGQTPIRGTLGMHLEGEPRDYFGSKDPIIGSSGPDAIISSALGPKALLFTSLDS